MKRIDIARALKPLSKYAEEQDADDEIVVLTSEDKPIAALIPLRNMDPESVALSTNQDFLDLIEQAREEIRAGKTVSLEEMRRSVLD